MKTKFLLLLNILYFSFNANADSVEDCEKQYPSEYKLQKYCIEKAHRSAKEITNYLERYDMSLENWISHKVEGKVAAIIYWECTNKYWTKGKKADITLMAYCLKTEEKAALELGKLGGNLEDSFYFEEGVSGDIAALGVLLNFIEKYNFKAGDAAVQAAKDGNVAAKIFIECKEEYFIKQKNQREQAKCLLRRENQELK